MPRPTPGGTAGLFAELLELFGETAQDFAAAIAEREWFDGGPRYPTLELQGAPGHTAREEFHFTNTGPSALTKVTFVATDLLGAADRIDAGEVTFKHGKDPHIPRVGPGQSARVAVAVAIPDAALTGTYRGVIAARSAAPTARAEAEGGPEDAWSLLELEVTAVDRRSAIAPAETVEA